MEGWTISLLRGPGRGGGVVGGGEGRGEVIKKISYKNT